MIALKSVNVHVRVLPFLTARSRSIILRVLRQVGRSWFQYICEREILLVCKKNMAYMTSEWSLMQYLIYSDK